LSFVIFGRKKDVTKLTPPPPPPPKKEIIKGVRMQNWHATALVRKARFHQLVTIAPETLELLRFLHMPKFFTIIPWTNGKCLATKHHQTLFGDQTFCRLATLFGAV